MALQDQALEAATPIAAPAMEALRPRQNSLVQLGRLAMRKPLGTFGAVVIIIMSVLAAFAPIVARYDPEEIFQRPVRVSTGSVFEAQKEIDASAAPTWKHWFGTDKAGKDLWSRIVWGTRRSLGVGVAALLIAVVIGTALGVISAYFGGKLDIVMQRVLDAFQAFPALFILILIASISKPSLRNLVLGLGIVGITQVSRIVRGTVLSLREMPYVEAARVVGATDLRIMLRHILPNTAAPIIVIFTIGLGTVILAEAALSFLTLAPSGVSWGIMLNEGQKFIQSSPWQAIFAGGAISMAVLAFNLFGDALRDVLDPRLRV
jgi:ABC-type dipeptide/oligopeptide/nickel transport system permease subunit